jgi:hypothetical protein
MGAFGDPVANFKSLNCVSGSAFCTNFQKLCTTGEDASSPPSYRQLLPDAYAVVEEGKKDIMGNVSSDGCYLSADVIDGTPISNERTLARRRNPRRVSQPPTARAPPAAEDPN